jgi:hypothetical protein
MKYSIRSRSDGTLFDALVNLARVLDSDGVNLLPEDELGSSSDAHAENEISGLEQRTDKKTEHEKQEQFFARIAQNLAVVKMDDSYIYNIVPVSLHEKNNSCHLL